MRYMALLALLSAAGLTACKNNPLAPTQTTAASSTPGAAAATPDSTAVPPDSLGNSTGDCEQTGEHSGECGSQAADSTETPGSESPEVGESPDSGATSETAGP